ncbi:MAG: hypothetical protein EBZ77_15800, partial [Chitinophagia bacterium]|nr:hypothetical protein [Chitinophagia bacterium]
NKYPVMIDLAVTPNEQGNSPADPEVPNATLVYKDEVTIEPAITDDEVVVHFPASFIDQEIALEVTGPDGATAGKKKLVLKKPTITLKCKGGPGTYTIKINGKHNAIAEGTAVKK